MTSRVSGASATLIRDWKLTETKNFLLKCVSLFLFWDMQINPCKKQKISNTAYYSLHRAEQTGSNQNRKRSGRPWCTTKHEEQYVRVCCLRNRHFTGPQLEASLNSACKRLVVASSVKRRVWDDDCLANKHKGWDGQKNTDTGQRTNEQQDNEPKHSSKVCKEYLGKEQSAGILFIIEMYNIHNIPQSVVGSASPYNTLKSAHQGSLSCGRFCRKHEVKSLQMTYNKQGSDRCKWRNLCLLQALLLSIFIPKVHIVWGKWYGHTVCWLRLLTGVLETLTSTSGVRENRALMRDDFPTLLLPMKHT